MSPEDRYVVLRETTVNKCGGWCVWDRTTASLACHGFPTSKVADRVRQALIAAYWEGAQDVKDGKVII